MANDPRNDAINCKFGTAQLGDVIPMPSPFKFGEVLAKLVRIDDTGRFTFHTYDLFLFGAKIGKAECRSDYTWRVCE